MILHIQTFEFTFECLFFSLGTLNPSHPIFDGTEQFTFFLGKSFKLFVEFGLARSWHRLSLILGLRLY